jgi:hypothetical protein
MLGGLTAVRQARSHGRPGGLDRSYFSTADRARVPFRAP